MIVRTLIVLLVFFACGAVMIWFTHRIRKTQQPQRRSDWLKFGIYLVLISMLAGVVWSGRWLVALTWAAITVAGTCEWYRHVSKFSSNAWLSALGFGVGVAICLAHALAAPWGNWQESFTFVLLLVAVTDSFSQLWGKLLGRTKMCPRLSPGKTREGFAGGVLTTLFAASTLGFLRPTYSPGQLLVAGLVIALSATCGDLVFSAIKRKLGIKDFSGALPGHGGVLDRFDSLIVTTPVFFWTGKLWLN
jgi:CDP-diglyceride synthetase